MGLGDDVDVPDGDGEGDADVLGLGRGVGVGVFRFALRFVGVEVVVEPPVLKLKFESIGRLVFMFVLILPKFALIFLFAGASFCKNQKRMAPRPRTTSVPIIVRATVLPVFEGGGGG